MDHLIWTFLTLNSLVAHSMLINRDGGLTYDAVQDNRSGGACQ